MRVRLRTITTLNSFFQRNDVAAGVADRAKPGKHLARLQYLIETTMCLGHDNDKRSPIEALAILEIMFCYPCFAFTAQQW